LFDDKNRVSMGRVRSFPDIINVFHTLNLCNVYHSYTVFVSAIIDIFLRIFYTYIYAVSDAYVNEEVARRYGCNLKASSHDVSTGVP